MMIKCFDMVSMVVEEATAQFSPLFKLNKEDYKILEQHCSTLDTLAKEFDGKSFDVEVNQVTKEVALTMECQEITVDTLSRKFLDLAQRSNSIGFSTNNGLLVVKFVFPSVWYSI